MYYNDDLSVWFLAVCQGRDTRQLQLDELTAHLRGVYSELNRKWILIFPEGGFLYKRLQTSQELVKLCYTLLIVLS